jgi:outer membrane protein OmpA-like peptidoglycan-associated protein/Tfp pilus assembly protein PilF
MKKSLFLALAVASAAIMSSCSKLGNLSADNFKVNPTPLEAIGGEVPATINGIFPEKYMKKKAVVTVTPVLKYEGGETVGKSATFQGEKVEGNGTEISYKVGGTYTMKTNFKYIPAMQSSDLYARFEAKLGKKTVSIPEIKIGYGVIATSELLSRCGITASTAPDAFQRVIEQKQEANIKFLIGQANLRTSELSSLSIQDLVKILKEINDMQEERALQNIEVSAYASPDGSFNLNEQLAEKRQNVSSNYLKKQLKKISMDADVDTKYTAEDWEGFQELISKSNLQDKDVILRVLSMYQDPEEREQQISNMSEVYTDIKEGILPELRRARLIVNYDVIGRSDEQILAQYKDNPAKLSVEELVYGANKLVADKATKKDWYNTLVKQFPSDYRALNNLAQMAIEEGDAETAKKYLQKAQSINKSASEVNTNLGLLALKSGDVKAAETYLAAGSGANTFNEVMGALNVAKGNYTQAATNMKGAKSNAAALAQILAKDYNSAKNTLNSIKNADAITSYLKAVLAARTGDTGALASNLKNAIQQDATLAARAAKDLEFAKYASTIKDIVK